MVKLLQASRLALNRKRSNILSNFLLTCLVILCIIFPKGGFKLSGIPITNGYLLFFTLVILCFVINLYSNDFGRICYSQLAVLSSVTLFVFISTVTILINGYNDFSYLISFFINLLVIPLSFLLILKKYILKIDLNYFIFLFKIAILLVSSFGIIMFFVKILFDIDFQIPFITSNVDDENLTDKFNNRGGISKLTSTYNNGNIYGISLLMFMPLYFLVEANKLFRFILLTSLVLTLSRTVWLGIVFYHVIKIFDSNLKDKVLISFSIICVLSGISFAMSLIGLDMDFILDANLGGRSESAFDFQISLFSASPFNAVSEIVPLAMLRYFGIVGVISFFILMLLPVLLWYIRLLPHSKSDYKKSLAIGLIVYNFIMFSDGALNYIPVMLFYWFLVALLLSNNIPSDLNSDSQLS